jgi:hypothetical protein
MTTDNTKRRVLAIGTPGGVASGFANMRGGDGLVRLGGGLMSLSADEYKLWDASQLAPVAWPLLEQASHAGVVEPTRTLLGLETAGLVLTCADEPDSVRRVTSGLSARLTGRLIGNGPYTSPRFLVSAHAAAPQLTVDVVIYQFLLWADGRTPIADLCAQIDLGESPPGFDAAAHVAGWIPRLLQAGLIGLDLAGPADGAP